MASLSEVVKLFLARKAGFGDLRRVLAEQGGETGVVSSITLHEERISVDSVRGWDGHKHNAAVMVSENGAPVAVLEEASYSRAAPYDGRGESITFAMGNFVHLRGVDPADLDLEVLHQQDYLTVLGERLANGYRVLALVTGSHSWSPGASIWHTGTERNSQDLYIRSDLRHPVLAAAIEAARVEVADLATCQAVLDTRWAWVYDLPTQLSNAVVVDHCGHKLRRLELPFGTIWAAQPGDALAARAIRGVFRWPRLRLHGEEFELPFPWLPESPAAMREAVGKQDAFLLFRPYWIRQSEAPVLWPRAEMLPPGPGVELAEAGGASNGEVYRFVRTAYPGVFAVEVFGRDGRYLWYSTDPTFVAAASGYTTQDTGTSLLHVPATGQYLHKGYYRDVKPGDNDADGWEFARQLHAALKSRFGDWLEFKVTSPQRWGQERSRCVGLHVEPGDLALCLSAANLVLRGEIYEDQWTQEHIDRLLQVIEAWGNEVEVPDADWE